MLDDRVDLLLQYTLLKAGEEDAFIDRDLGPIHLLKYVYLADLAYAKSHNGETFTGAPWIFYHFGPWSNEVHQRIEPALRAIRADRKDFPSDYEDRPDWVRWSLTNDRLCSEKQKSVPFDIRVHLDGLIHKFRKDTPALLDHVYRTAPMLAAAPGEKLDFALEPPFVRAERPAEPQPSRTPRQLKKLREAAKAMRQQHSEKSQTQDRFVPKPPPHDPIFEAGIAWLDSLAGENFSDGELTAEFSPEVWKSSARKTDGVP
tara:strand:+ start:20173 stop:20949 length:777 start_codon:yes stop_codon:yes gene_type:complete